MIQLRVPVVAFAALLCALFAGCPEKPVRTYAVPKDASAPLSSAPASAAAAPAAVSGELPPGHPPIGGATAAAPGADASALPPGHPPIGTAPAAASPAGPANSVTWAAPDHWTAKPLGPMRRGSFTVKTASGDADLSIFVFPAATNPLAANINRWRGQVGLAPLTEAQLPAESTALASAGLEFTVVDLLGKQPGSDAPTRVLGAILYRGAEAWFFKLGGPDAAVATEKAAFLDFLRTVRPAAP